MNNLVKEFLQSNLLSAAEAADKLGVTKQTVFDLVKKKRIVPAFTSSNAIFFFLSEIEQLRLQTKFMDNLKNCNNTFWCHGSSSKCYEFYHNNLCNLDDIVFVMVANNEYFLICEKFYTCENIVGQNLQNVNAPRMVIADSQGHQIWLDSCNCGYGGEGPNTTLKILRDLGIEKSVENIKDLIYNKEVVIIQKLENNWVITSREKEPFEKLSINTRGRIYKNVSNLVFLQRESEFSFYESNSLEFLQMYFEFMVFPKELIVMSEEKAIEAGYYYQDFNRREIFNIVLQDVSGNELWLQMDLDDEKSLGNQISLLTLFKKNGFEIDLASVQKKSSQIAEWLGIVPKRDYHKYSFKENYKMIEEGKVK